MGFIDGKQMERIVERTLVARHRYYPNHDSASGRCLYSNCSIVSSSTPRSWNGRRPMLLTSWNQPAVTDGLSPL